MSELTLTLGPDALEVLAARAAEILAERTEPERWLSQKELAAHFGCSVRTILTYQNAGMPHLMIGSHPRFKASECEAWLRARAGRGRLEPTTNGAASPAGPAPGHRKDGSDAKQQA